MPEDNGFLQINDVILNIPPQQISVDRQSAVHQRQTLRTRSSIKSQSGYSVINISIRATFTSRDVSRGTEIVNGFQQLSDLVSQFRITPFCYVENQFLRNSILGGSLEPSMALVLRQLQIVKDNNNTNTLNVVFHFSWFNYFPFLREWTYKRDLFGSTSVKNPRQSAPWKLMYYAEQQRNFYTPGLGKLDGNVKLEFTQFATCSVKKYQQLEKEVQALRELRTDLANQEFRDSEMPINTLVSKKLGEELGLEAGRILTDDMFGHITSQTPNREVLQEIGAVISKAINPDTTSRYSTVVAFTPVVTGEGLVRHKDSMDASNRTNKDPELDDTLLVERKRKLNMNESGIVITGVSLSFENILAELPLVGHPYPTFQHIGSIDTVLSISIMTTDGDSIQTLSNFYSVIEDQAMKFRMIPQGHRNVSVTNDIVNLCGLNDFIPTAMTIDTVPGQPGTYSAQLTLVDNPLTADTKEQIMPASAFSTSNDIRNMISSIMLRNLKLRSDIVDLDTIDTSEVKLVDWHQRARIDPRTGEQISEHDYQQLDDTDRTLIIDNNEWDGRRLKDSTKLINGFYEYAPIDGNEAGGRDTIFQDLCTTYGRRLGFLWAQLVEVLQETRLKTNVAPLTEFYSLTDDDAPAMTKVQEDITGIFKKNKQQIPYRGDDLEVIRKSAQRIVEKSKQAGLDIIQSASRFKRERGNWITGSEQRIVDTLNEGVVENTLNRLLNFIDEHLQEWINWSTKFLDRIIYEGFLELRQFEKVRGTLDAQTASNYSTGCYPDFPLRQVANLIETEGSDAIKQVMEELKNAQKSGDFGLRNASLDILIQPDFYLYNRLTDDISSIIPWEVQQKAVETVIDNQKSKKIDAEVNWIEDHYEKQVLDSRLTDQIRREARDDQFDTAFWKNKDTRSAATTVMQSTRAAFHIDDLVNPDSNIGLMSSILEEDYATGNERGSIPMVDISQSTLDELAKSQRGTRMPGSIVHRERTGTLVPNHDHYAQVQHFFGPDSIAMKSENAYTPPPKMLNADPNKDPVWRSPVEAGMVITSLWGYRDDPTKPGEGKQQFHYGIDFAGPGRGEAQGKPVFAPADGWIVKINRKPWEEDTSSGESNLISIQHANGYHTDYRHLAWEGETIETWEKFWGVGGVRRFFGVEATGKGTRFFVQRGTIIGRIGNTGERTTGPHLHWGVKKNGQHVDPLSVPGLAQAVATGTRNWNSVVRRRGGVDISEKYQGPVGGLNPANESLFTKSVNQLEKDLASGQGYSLMRAYPTFKLYFIESDMGERKRFGFDDFFQYSSVESIKVIENRKIAADLVMLTLTNVSGVLSNRKFRNAIHTRPDGSSQNLDEGPINQGSVSKEDPLHLQKTNTTDENPFSSMMLEPGIQLQLRLGYNNHPDELETVFNGIITDVQFTECDDMVQIVCQSFSIELTQNLHGKAKTFGGFLSDTGRTGALLEQLMSFPEVVHFGRWEGGKARNTARGLLKSSWKFLPTPYDDNIFAPTGRGIFGIFDSTVKYTLYQSTLWDVFQEMALRHPSYVASAVPYQGKWGPRMTMFFGVPDQMYFARDPTFKEDRAVDGLKKFVSDAVSTLRSSRSKLDDAIDPNKTPDAEKMQAELERNEDEAIKNVREFWLKNQIRNFALDQGYVKPFRNYHVATSTQHILMNNIESSNNVFNTVTLQYGDKAAEIDDTARELKFGDLETFTLRCDAAVQDEEVKELFAQYHNCVGYEMAKRYAVGLLFYSLKESYRGVLTMIGNPKIKPYDIVYIFDEYTDMFGPIEVEQVIHEFSQRRGFVTEITPDMVVHVNQHTTMSSGDAMALAAEAGLRKMGLQSMPSLLTSTNQAVVGGALAGGAAIASAAGVSAAAASAGLGAAALAFNVAFTPIANMFFNSTENSIGHEGNSAFGLIGTFFFKKLITRSQLAHPFRYSPLVKHGRAMVGALPNRRTGGTFIQSLNRWAREADEGIGLMLHDVYEKIRPNNWLGKTQGSWIESLKGEVR